MQKPKNVSGYIAAANPKARSLLRALRTTIRTAVPQAVEKLSYGMPYYSYRGRLMYFAAFRDHVSVFVMGVARKKYARELKRWQTGKATLRFPIGKPLPLGLIAKLARAQARANAERM